MEKGQKNIEKGEEAANGFLILQENLLNPPPWSWWLVAVLFHFVVFGTEGVDGTGGAWGILP